MPDDRLLSVCERLPLFPLPDAVLIPGGMMPLHVFEPRYRDLVRHCLDGEPLMGIATLRPGTRGDDEERPAVYGTVGVGELVAHQALPDGRYYIVLRYVGRVSVDEELDGSQAFRVVRASVLSDDAKGAEPALARLKPLLLQLGARSSDDDDPQRAIREGGLELVNAVASEVLQSSDARRAYLEHDRIVDRIAMLEERLITLLTEATLVVGEA
jgi:hypothetical protein